jgi:hypothetical protein
MAKKDTTPKEKAAAKPKPVTKKAAAKKTAAKRKTAPKSKNAPRKRISVHHRLADAILSLRKFAPEEMEEIRALSARADTAAGRTTSCWISDSGGEQHCINLTPDDCTRKGGISVPTKCPNT